MPCKVCLRNEERRLVMKKQIDYGSYASYKETVKGLTENLKSLLGLSEEIAMSILRNLFGKHWRKLPRSILRSL